MELLDKALPFQGDLVAFSSIAIVYIVDTSRTRSIIYLALVVHTEGSFHTYV